MKIKFENQLTGEVLNEWTLNPSQEKFWNSARKFVLFSGGYGCGKSLMLTLKAIDLAVRYPDNYILMGRRTYPELRDTLWKEFINLCPEHLIAGEPKKAEMKITFVNGSEIIFRHLDTISESEIRSLNLGAAFIDQAEDIPREVFLGLRGRLRRDSVAEGDRRIYLSCNPALTWLFSEFKQNPQPEYEVIEASTMENAANLPKEYIEDLLKYPESYKRQYVYGVWDESLLSDNIVFAREYIERLNRMWREPLRVVEELKVYKEYVHGHQYQMGIDSAEGGISGDNAVVKIVDLTAEEEAASYVGKIAPDVLAEKAIYFARMYQKGDSRCVILPEMNSIGLALVNKLKQEEDIRIYRREEFDKRANKRLLKLGWRTTRQSKPLLVSRFQELLRLRSPKIYDRETVEEFKTFVHTEDAHKNGMGAQEGFHDDRVVALLLAFWKKGEVVPGEVIARTEKADVPPAIKESPFLKLIRGRLVMTSPKPVLEITNNHWTM